jgi:uncharacterized integral membrane protein
MADPQHIASLTPWDVVSVRAYRAGLLGAALGIVALAIESLYTPEPAGSVWVVFASLQVAVWNLHVYDARFRRVFRGLAVLSAVFCGAGWLLDVDLLVWAGLGWAFAALSGIGLKERLCFKIPGMRVLPVVLAASLVPLVAGVGSASCALLAVSAALATGLALTKIRQPLHYDIGDKSRYQS